MRPRRRRLSASLVAASLLAATLLIGRTGPAYACSCRMAELRDRFARSDGAFVGALVRRQDPSRQPDGSVYSGDDATFTFAVERGLKGELPAEVDVRSASSGASCGLETAGGERIGLLLSRDESGWRSSLCSQANADALIRASMPLPAADGTPPGALLIGGNFGEARVLLTDAEGRTLAWGMGDGNAVAMSVCPGGRRMVELVRDDLTPALSVATRSLPGLELERTVPVDPAGSQNFAISCRDEAAAASLLFGSTSDGAAASGRIDRVTPAGHTPLWSGDAGSVAFGAGAAFVLAGPAGAEIGEVDLADGTRRSKASLAGRAVADGMWPELALSPDEARVAMAAPGRAVMVELSNGRVLEAALDRPDLRGTMAWSGGDAVVFTPLWHEAPDGVVFDAELAVRARIADWNGGRSVVSGGVVYANRLLPGHDRRFGTLLRAATASAASSRDVRELDSPEVEALAAAPGPSGQSTPTPSPATSPVRTLHPGTSAPTQSPAIAAPAPAGERRGRAGFALFAAALSAVVVALGAAVAGQRRRAR